MSELEKKELDALVERLLIAANLAGLSSSDLLTLLKSGVSLDELVEIINLKLSPQ